MVDQERGGMVRGVRQAHILEMMTLMIMWQPWRMNARGEIKYVTRDEYGVGEASIEDVKEPLVEEREGDADGVPEQCPSDEEQPLKEVLHLEPADREVRLQTRHPGVQTEGDRRGGQRHQGVDPEHRELNHGRQYPLTALSQCPVQVLPLARRRAGLSKENRSASGRLSGPRRGQGVSAGEGARRGSAR